MTRELIVTTEARGLSETINQLFKLSEKAMNNLEFVEFVKKMFAGSSALEIFRKLHNYLYTYIKYQQDDYEESITAPYLLSLQGYGDCDDFALYAYTALKILGFDASMMIMGEASGFGHIVAAVIYNGNLYIIDGTNSVFNQIPERYTRLKYV